MEIIEEYDQRHKIIKLQFIKFKKELDSFIFEISDDINYNKIIMLVNLFTEDIKLNISLCVKIENQAIFIYGKTFEDQLIFNSIIC